MAISSYLPETEFLIAMKSFGAVAYFLIDMAAILKEASRYQHSD